MSSRPSKIQIDGAGDLRRVLVVAYYFPPISTSGAMRPLGFCRYLREYGWCARVLTTDSVSVIPPLAHDDLLGAQVPNTIEVDRVGHQDVLGLLLRMTARLRKEAPVAATTAIARSDGPSRRVRDWLSRLKDAAVERLFEFPDRQCGWYRPAVRRLWNLPAAERPDLVLATGGPWTSLLVGQSLAGRFGVPLVIDFRDPWTRNPFRRQHAFEKRVRSLERSVCEASARVIVNTPELHDQFARDYPEFEHKFITITNGFDSVGDAAGRPTNVGREAGGLQICHFGTVYGHRDPLALLLAMQQLADENKIRPEVLRVRFVGAWEVSNDTTNRVAGRLEATGFLERAPSMPHEACLREIQNAKVLLAIQPASPLQIPAKIYEYVASGRPLIVIGGEGATAALVERHRLGLCCGNAPGPIKQMLLGLVSGDVQLFPPLPADVARFHYRDLTGQLAHVLDAASQQPHTR